MNPLAMPFTVPAARAVAAAALLLRATRALANPYRSPQNGLF